MLNKQIKFAAVILIAFALVGSFVATINSSSQAVAAKHSTSVTPKAQGIEGTITYGPTSPICGDTNPCYIPYETTMSVYNAKNNNYVTSFSSDSEGMFSVELKAGTYVVKSDSISRFNPPAQTVKVVSGSYTDLSITFDSGIR